MIFAKDNKEHAHISCLIFYSQREKMQHCEEETLFFLSVFEADEFQLNAY